MNRDKKPGSYFEWYDNSSPRIVGEYQNIQKDGTWYYYEQSRDYLSAFGAYVDDMREGPTR
jgi:antitoxin component YwqK of YwqJK toxin-antitoxin module